MTAKHCRECQFWFSTTGTQSLGIIEKSVRTVSTNPLPLYLYIFSHRRFAQLFRCIWPLLKLFSSFFHANTTTHITPTMINDIQHDSWVKQRVLLHRLGILSAAEWIISHRNPNNCVFFFNLFILHWLKFTFTFLSSISGEKKTAIFIIIRFIFFLLRRLWKEVKPYESHFTGPFNISLFSFLPPPPLTLSLSFFHFGPFLFFVYSW